MSDIIRIDQNARRSRAAVFGNLVFLAGQVADDKTGDITKQTHEALTKVDDMLSRAGTDKSRLLSMRSGSRPWTISTA
jgi:enamine deaminase RidA (YjgF/YER057c/UK114 family)